MFTHKSSCILRGNVHVINKISAEHAAANSDS